VAPLASKSSHIKSIEFRAHWAGKGNAPWPSDPYTINLMPYWLFISFDFFSSYLIERPPSWSITRSSFPLPTFRFYLKVPSLQPSNRPIALTPASPLLVPCFRYLAQNTCQIWRSAVFVIQVGIPYPCLLRQYLHPHSKLTHPPHAAVTSYVLEHQTCAPPSGGGSESGGYAISYYPLVPRFRHDLGIS